VQTVAHAASVGMGHQMFEFPGRHGLDIEELREGVV